MTWLGFLYLLLSFATGALIAILLPVRIPKWGKTLIGPSLGMVLLTEITFFSAFLFSMSLPIIFGSLILLILISIALYRKKIDQEETREKISESWPIFAVLVLIGSFLLYCYSRILSESPTGLMTLGAGLYGDTAFHCSQITSFVAQGVPIPNPLYAGIFLKYPFLVNFHAACLVKLGVSLHQALMIPQMFHFLALVTLFHFLFKRFTNNLGVFFAFLIFFLGWGFGFVDYVRDWISSGQPDITQEYTNGVNAYRMQNFLTALILPQRTFLPGIVIGLLFTFLFFNSETPTMNRAIWSGVLLGILPLWHGHTFLYMTLCVLVWTPFQYRNARGKNIRQILVMLSIAFVLAFPIVFWFSKQSAGFRFQTSWIANSGNLILFWLKNAGFVLPTALGIWLKLDIKGRFFFLPAFIGFVAANFLILQPWDWDNIKILLWVFLFLAVLAGRFLTILFSRTVPYKIAAVLLLFTMIFSGILSLLFMLKKESIVQIYDKSDIHVASWVTRNTDPNDIFLISDAPSHPLPGLTGRTAYLGYPGHLWSHGIDYRPRLAVEKRILSGDLSAMTELDVPVNYVIAEKKYESSLKGKKQLQLLFQNDKYLVFKISL